MGSFGRPELQLYSVGNKINPETLPEHLSGPVIPRHRRMCQTGRRAHHPATNKMRFLERYYDYIAGKNNLFSNATHADPNRSLSTRGGVNSKHLEAKELPLKPGTVVPFRCAIDTINRDTAHYIMDISDRSFCAHIRVVGIRGARGLRPRG